MSASADLMTSLKQIVRRVRRLGRKARAIVGKPRATLVVHQPGYRAPENTLADPERAEKILHWLAYQGVISSHHVARPSKATIAQLHRVHPWPYLSGIGEADRMTRIFGEHVVEVAAREFVEQQRWMTGGTVRAARIALREGRGHVAVNLGGGFHHAYADGGFGFNAFNDIAVAIAELRADGFDGHVLVLDLDAHQGDGTRNIFAHDPTVTTLSLHDVDWDERVIDTSAAAMSRDRTTTRAAGPSEPNTKPAEHDARGKRPRDINVALGRGIDDAAFMSAFAEHVPGAINASRPDLVIYVAGTDVVQDDPVGSWRLTAEGVLWRDQRVLGACSDIPVVWLLAGGYGGDTWRLTARSLAWWLAGLDAPIKSRTQRELESFRGIARRLGAEELAVDDSDGFEVQTADLLEDLRHPGMPTRLLGYYTRYGVEVALEEYGVLAHIRDVVGDVPLRVELDLQHSTGQMVRLVTDDSRRDLLIELVLDERQDIPRPDDKAPPFKLLWLEWLLLQNPRDDSRPSLPGQAHPGLGCARHIIGMLLMACERLGYDGLAFNPAHYHIAALGAAAGAVFVDPEEQARFLAIKSALAGHDLGRATHIVASDQVVDTDTGDPLEWTSTRMVLPVEDELERAISSPEWQAAVAEAGTRFSAKLPPDLRPPGSLSPH